MLVGDAGAGKTRWLNTMMGRISHIYVPTLGYETREITVPRYRGCAYSFITFIFYDTGSHYQCNQHKIPLYFTMVFGDGPIAHEWLIMLREAHLPHYHVKTSYDDPDDLLYLLIALLEEHP